MPTHLERALEFVPFGAVVGLGTGRAATEFLKALAERVRQGDPLRGVPTSRASAEMAQRLGVPLATLDQVGCRVDVTVDGADEVDPHFNAIKGLGGALLREKVVAAASNRLVLLVGPQDVELKVTPCIGTRGILPVEVLPFAAPLVLRRLQQRGLAGEVRIDAGEPFVTDNGNWIVHVRIQALENPHALERTLAEIPGVLGTGLFLGMADCILVQRGETVEVRERPASCPPVAPRTL